MGRGDGSRQTIRASARSGGRGAIEAAVVCERPPRNLVDDGSFFAERILDVGAGLLTPWPAQANSQAEVADLLSGLSLAGGHLVVQAPGQPLHVVTIERLPAWKEVHSQPEIGFTGRTYKDHLGVGVYVYDLAGKRWLKRALHGRGEQAAHSRPFASPTTALRNASRYADDLREGLYRADQALDRFPRALAKAAEAHPLAAQDQQDADRVQAQLRQKRQQQYLDAQEELRRLEQARQERKERAEARRLERVAQKQAKATARRERLLRKHLANKQGPSSLLYGQRR